MLHENTVYELGEDVAEGIRSWVNGQYDGIAGWSEYRHAGASPWERKSALGDFAERYAEGIPESERRVSDRIYSAIISARSAQRTVLRTEVIWSSDWTNELSRFLYGSKDVRADLELPHPDDILSFGIKSASKDPRFAEKVAADEIPGMGRRHDSIASTGSEVIAFRIEDCTRYLDVEPFSDWDEQHEVLIAGRYRVVSVTDDVVDVSLGIGQVQVTPREYAAHQGEDIELFTSQKGSSMAKFGGRAYPVEMLDSPANLWIEAEDIRPVTIHYVDLVELPVASDWL